MKSVNNVSKLNNQNPLVLEQTMPLDHYVTLGHSGLRVSPFAMGGFTFGGHVAGFGTNAEESEPVLDRYIELGGNFIDTANGYNKGHSEKIIGDYIARSPEVRDRLVIATKFSANLYPGDPNGGGSSRKSIIAACEQSLRRLQTDYIDLYWLHNWDKHTPIEETMATLQTLVQSGKVRYVGVSDTPAWKVAQAQVLAQCRGWSQFIGLQIEYSLLERTVEAEQIPMAKELGLGVTVWGPLAGGLLSGEFTRKNKATPPRQWLASALNDKSYSIIDAIKRIAGELDTSAARVALAWVRARSNVSVILMGANTVAQLEDNIKALDLQLSPEHTAALDALTSPQLPWPIEFLRHAPSLQAGGTTINGEPSQTHPFVPSEKGDHY